MYYFQRQKVTILGLIMLIFGFSQGAMAQTGTYALGIDTVAGQSTILKAKNFPADSSVIIHVNTADQKNINILDKANAAGEISVELSSLHTRKSGIYTVFASASDGTLKSPTNSFHVYEGEMDANLSYLGVDRSIIKSDGIDSAKINVILSDKYGNSLSNRAVKLITSNGEVIISPLTKLTDHNGVAKFNLSSTTKGLLSVMALDTTSDDILTNRIKISFVNEDLYVSDAGGDILNKAYAAGFGPLDHFEIDGIPANVSKNENVSFTVKAVDTDGLVVEDYTGTIRFSAEGANSSAVSLPENYKFLATDLGQHKFSLGLSFAEDATYKIVVSDLSDKFKQGDQTVVVGSTSGGSSGSSPGEKPLITVPAAGTYSQAEQTISGTAKTSSTIKVYDNNQEIASVPVGPTGKYSYQSDALADGAHSIYVVNTDTISLEVIGTSDTVDINIDTTPPALDEINLDPATNIQPGSVIDVKVYSEANLSQAALIFNYDIVELNASLDDPSVYVGTIQAPQDPGVYSLNVLLVDELQNEITYEDQANVTVDTNGGTAQPNTTDATDTTDGQVLPVAGAPSTVTGLIAYGSDKRVTLVWDASSDDVMVKNYRIYYGTTIQDMQFTIETSDASTTWYVPNLDNGKEYFFTLTAIDDQGNESTAKSEIVSGIPFVLEIKNALSEAPTSSIADNQLHQSAYNGPFPSQTTSTGPEVLVLLGSSLLVGYVVRRKK